MDLIHGGAVDEMARRFPGAPRPWLDLSTGVNPWPYPIEGDVLGLLTQLPTQHAVDDCTSAMAAAWGAPVPAVCPTPGSELLIRWLPTVLPARRVVVTRPCYGDHAAAWRAAGVEVVETRDPAIDSGHADLVVICNPNNPDGRHWSREALERLHRRLAGRGGWLVVDEAFGELQPDLSMAALAGRAGLVVLRSFGKFFGLPGLRLGALLAPPEVLRAALRALGQWRVSSLALQVGARAYRDGAWAARTRRHLAGQRAALDAMLAAADIEVAGGTDLFRCVGVPDAHDVWQRLAHHGVYVRRFADNTTRLRIGLPRDAAAADRLSRALAP